MTKKNVSKIFLKLIPFIFYTFLVIFLILYLKKIDYSQFTSVHLNWYFVILATLFGLAMRFWQVFIWVNLLRNLGAKNLSNDAPQLTFIYAKSWLGRYIPGTAPWILGKIFFASKHGIQKSKLAVSSLLEGALQIAVVMILSLAILLFSSGLTALNTNFALFIITLIICVTAILPPVFNSLITFAYKIIRKEQLGSEHLVSNKTIIQTGPLYIVSALLSGVSLFFIAKAIDPTLTYTNLLYVIGLSNLAGAMGMLAIFAPSGIGVRDSIILSLLSLVVKPEYALIITIAARLWDVVIDLLFVLLSKIVEILFSTTDLRK